MVRRLLGILGMPVLLAGLVWLGGVLYFQQDGKDISGSGILTWFVLLPLAVIAVWFVGKLVIARSKRTADSSADSAPTEAQQGTALDTSLSLRLAIVAAEVNTSAGESPADIVQSLRRGNVQPSLADHLSDANGMPVKAAISADLVEDEHLPWVEKWLSSQRHGHSLSVTEGARLLALLHAPLERALETLSGLPPPDEDIASEPTHTVKRTLPRRQLVTRIFAPAAWQEMVTAYVREQVSRTGNHAFGVVRPDPQRPELQSDALRVADSFCKASENDHAESIFMIVACDSLTSQRHVEALEMQGQLFTSNNQAGVIPGEAAAVILATPQSMSGADISILAALHRAAHGTRQEPVNAGGRIDPEQLQHLATAALAHARLQSGDVGALVSDCDHRSAWLTESAMLVSSQLPELDPVADHLSIGHALGNTGEAGSALALALAAHASSMDKSPLLAASVSDARARSIVALSPWSAPEHIAIAETA